jgi:hypothetical protein
MYFCWKVAASSYNTQVHFLFAERGRENAASPPSNHCDLFDLFPLATLFRHQSGFGKSLYPNPRLQKIENFQSCAEKSSIKEKQIDLKGSQKLKVGFRIFTEYNLQASNTGIRFI